MCSREVNLTEEEKETLKAEGLPIPTTLPLTKVCVYQLCYDRDEMSYIQWCVCS